VEAKDIARRPPITIPSSSSIREAAVVMARNNIGFLPVVDPEEPSRLVGVISERDIVKAVASGIDLGLKVSEISRKDVISVRTTDPLWKVAKLMRDNKIRHIVVVEDDKLYGVISIRDLIGEEIALKNLAELAYHMEEGTGQMRVTL